MAEKTTRELAVEWVDRLNAGAGLNGAWRLQRLDRRSRVRVSPDGSDADSSDDVERTDLPVRIRRFCNGVPWALVDEAIKYLHETAPYTGIVYNGVPIEGRYVPTRTWWQRDEETIVDKGRYVEGTYTLLQDLVDADAADALDYASGGSCSEEVLTEYVWDAFAAPALPSESLGQGWTTSVQAMSRNEDGTFNYAVVRRHAITQHSAKTVTKCDKFETAEVETWDNLYGTPGAYVDDTGAPVAVPEPCEDRRTGVVVELSVQENNDCTYKVAAQTTTSKTVRSRVARKQTLFGQTETVVDRADSGSDRGYEGGADGVVKTKSSEIRPDGRYDNTVETEIERPVASAEVVRSKTLHAVKTRTTDKNQRQDGGLLTKELAVGETVSVKRTDGGLYDLVHERVDELSVGDVGDECRRTTYLHSHTRSSNRVERPPTDVGAAGGGVVRTRRSKLTEEGTWDVAEQTDVEIPVANAEVARRRTLRGTKTSSTHRNQSPEAAEAKGRRALAVGEAVTLRRTDGGLYDVVEEAVSATPAGDVAEECSRTIFRHDHSTTVNRSSKLKAGEGGDFDVEIKGDGVVRKRTARMTEEGTWDVTYESTEEIPVEDAEVTRRRTLRGTRTTRTSRGQDSGTAKAAGGKILAVGQSVSLRRTEGGLYDVTEESVAATSAGDVAKECAKTKFRHRHSTTVNQATAGADEATASAGVSQTKASRLTEEGTWDVTTETTTDLPMENAVLERRRTLRGTRTTKTNRNMDSTGGAETRDLKVGESVVARMTDTGLYDVTEETVEAEEAGAIAESCSDTKFKHRHTKTSNKNEYEGGDVDQASGGTVRSREARRTEEGTWDVVEETSTERSVARAAVEYRKTLHGLRTRTTDRSSESPPTPPKKVGESASYTVTDGGLYDVTTDKLDPEDVGETGLSKAPNAFLSENTTTYESKSSGKPSLGEAKYKEGELVSAEYRLTEDGAYDKTVQKRVAKYRHWDVLLDTSHMYSITKCFRNAKESEVEQLKSDLVDKAQKKMDSWSESDRLPASQRFSPEMTLNEFGLFDGAIGYTATWSTGQAGQGKEKVDKEFFSVHHQANGHVGIYHKTTVGRGYNELRKVTAWRVDAGFGREIAEIHSSLNLDPVSLVWTYSYGWKTVEAD